MTYDELQEQFAELYMRHMALRDVVAWLVGREIGGTTDPEATLRLLSELGTRRATSIPPEDAGDLRNSEIAQQEIDWVVAAAKKGLDWLQRKKDR